MRPTTWTKAATWVSLALMTTAANCAPKTGGDDEDTDVPTDTDVPGDTDPGSDTDVTACEPSLLPGLWLSATYSIDIGEDLSFDAAGAPNMAQIDVSGQISVDGCQLSFVDASGVFACPSEQVGEYTYTVDATTLTLTAVSDPCAGRLSAADGAVLLRD